MMECSFCGEEINTKPVMLCECFGCGKMLPNCQSDACMDAMDCSNCLNEPKNRGVNIMHISMRRQSGVISGDIIAKTYNLPASTDNRQKTAFTLE